jgi:hypothetical protein
MEIAVIDVLPNSFFVNFDNCQQLGVFSALVLKSIFCLGIHAFGKPGPSTTWQLSL